MPENKEENKIDKIHVDTLIISDIHLGASNARVDELMKVLRTHEFKRLILNGDVVDGLNFKRLNRHHWNILSMIRKLSKQCEVVWIRGNHDEEATFLSNLIGVKIFNQYNWKEKGQKCLAIHGHQFDRFWYSNYLISTFADYLYRTLKKYENPKHVISRWLRSRRGWLRLSEEVAQGAFYYAKMRAVDFIFCGHTHIAVQKEMFGIRYYNSGSWLENPSSYITITHGEVKIINIE